MCVCECVISEGREVWPGGGREGGVMCFFSCSSSNICQ